MAFIDKVPEYILQVEGEIVQLSRDRMNIDWGHDCDCEYCDRREDIPEEAEVEANQIDTSIKQDQRLIKSLKNYQAMFAPPTTDNKESV